MSAYYNETLHDKTGSFLYQAIQGSGKLSEGACEDIRSLFDSSLELRAFIRAYVDVDNLEMWDLVDQVFPPEREEALLYFDEDGDPANNYSKLMK
jgi:hypothetical protein